MYSLIMLLVLTGPPIEHHKQNIYILVDSKDIRSQSQEIVTKSRRIYQDLEKYSQYFPTQEFYINHYWNIIIEEYEDKRLSNKPVIPSFRFNKSDDYKEFCPGTFQSPGSFYVSLYSILAWEKYIVAIESWHPYKDNDQIFTKSNNKYGLKNWYYKNQPPSHPLIYPSSEYVTEDITTVISTAWFYYDYKHRFSNAEISRDKNKKVVRFQNFEIFVPVDTEDAVDIDDEDVMGAVFSYEYSDNNLWFCGIKND